MADDGNLRSGDGKQSDLLFRLVASGALGLSIVSGGITVSSTDQRIRAPEVDAALAIRDAHIHHLTEQYKELKEQVDRIDQNGPAVGNAGFERRISRLEQKIDR